MVVRAILALRRKLLAMADAVAPELAIFERSLGLTTTMMLGAVANAGIADLLEKDGPLTAKAIAARTGTNADAMHRMLRVLASMGIFRARGERFENTALSRVVCSTSPHRFRDWLAHCASSSVVDAWRDFERTLATGKNAFVRVHGKSAWAWHDEHPEERETFARAMTGITYSSAPLLASLYPFAEVERVCDVGGGRGLLLSEILVRHPHLTGVLCDAPGVVASAKTLLERRGVLARVELVGASFFEKVPSGADAYVMKTVLHDWDDETCVKLLRNVRAASRKGARVIICEQLLERNQASGFGPLSDVLMMVESDDGRERSRADFERLLSKAGFRMHRIFPSPIISVVEGVAVQE
jgi:hypothetical protein